MTVSLFVLLSIVIFLMEFLNNRISFGPKQGPNDHKTEQVSKFTVACFSSKRKRLAEDFLQKLEPEVRAEKERINNCDLKHQATQEPLIVHDLVKVFKKKAKKSSSSSFYAVNHLSFGVAPTECFG